jgi:hypothetical protein
MSKHYPFAYQFGGGARYHGYKYQYGGGMPVVYGGLKYQSGEGLGDVLRGIGRFILPIIAPLASRAATSFISNTSRNLAEGQSWKQASKNSLSPMIDDTIDETKQVVRKRMQSGGGHGSSKPKYVQFGGPRQNQAVAYARALERRLATRRKADNAPKRTGAIRRKAPQTGRGVKARRGLYKARRRQCKSRKPSKKTRKSSSNTNF